MKGSTFLALSLLANSIAFAEQTEHREHGSHEHGHAQLNIILENQAFNISMESPSNNVFGFEHKPNNAEQHEIIDIAVKDLKNFGSLIQISEKAKCTVSDADVHQPFESEEEHEEHKDKHDDDHGEHKDESKHDDGHNGEHKDDHEKNEASTHSDVDIDVSFSCQNAAKLTKIDLTPLFKRFPNFEEIDVQGIINGQQTALEVTKKQPIISLK